MSFRRPKIVQAEPAPAAEPVVPPQGGVAPATSRKKRLASGGVQGTFLGGLGGPITAPAPTLTGVSG
jgi:hypothetical protein